MRLLFTPGVRVALVSADPSPATLALAAARVHGVDLVPMRPVEALERLHGGDVAVGRLDVRPTLDGVEDGLWTLGVLAARGVTGAEPRRRPPGGARQAPHGPAPAPGCGSAPATWSVRGDRPPPPSIQPPAVVKPRHGSWGRSVAPAPPERRSTRKLDRVRHAQWYRAHGAILQGAGATSSDTTCGSSSREIFLGSSARGTGVQPLEASGARNAPRRPRSGSRSHRRLPRSGWRSPRTRVLGTVLAG